MNRLLRCSPPWRSRLPWVGPVLGMAPEQVDFEPARLLRRLLPALEAGPRESAAAGAGFQRFATGTKQPRQDHLEMCAALRASLGEAGA